MQSFSLERHVFVPLLLGASLLSCEAAGAQLAMGFRVGEVKQDSAIIWTRITKNSERNWKGYREPTKRQAYVDEYVPSKINVADRQGEVLGAPGQVCTIGRRSAYLQRLGRGHSRRGFRPPISTRWTGIGNQVLGVRGNSGFGE